MHPLRAVDLIPRPPSRGPSREGLAARDRHGRAAASAARGRGASSRRKARHGHGLS